MEILAVGTNFKTSDKKFITNMFTLVLGEEIVISVLDLISHRISTTGKEVVVTFGKKARDLFTSSKEKYLVHISMPEVKNLISSEGNESFREQAYKQLLQLKTLNVKSDTEVQVISQDQLPEIDSKYLLASLVASQTKEWQGINKEGKSIKLTLEPTEVKTADINLTFAEFLLLKETMGTLDIKEFQIVTNSRTDNKS